MSGPRLLVARGPAGLAGLVGVPAGHSAPRCASPAAPTSARPAGGAAASLSFGVIPVAGTAPIRL